MRIDVIFALFGFVIGAACLAEGDDDADLRHELERLQRQAARLAARGWEQRGAAPMHDDRGFEIAFLPVRDVSWGARHALAPSYLLELDGSKNPLFGGFGGFGQSNFGGDLAELLRCTIDPARWEEATITPHGNALIVFQRPATIARMRQFLDKQIRPRMHRGVAIEFELVSVPATLARSSSGGAVTDEWRALLDASLRGGKSRMVLALRGNGSLGSRFTVWHGRQVAVLGDHDVEVASTATVSDPVVQVVQAGGLLSVYAATSASAKRIDLTLGLRLDELRALRRQATRRGAQLELPDIQTQQADVSMSVAPGRWAVAASGMPAPGDHRIFLVRAHVLERGPR